MHEKTTQTPSVTPYVASDRMRDLIMENNLLILVMGRFGMPLGFGNKSVAECCDDLGVNTDTFLAVANYVSHRPWEGSNIDLQSLMGYLQKAHEYYLDFNLPTIRRKLVEAISHTGEDDVALLILRLYDEYVGEVRRHMEYENRTVFSYVEGVLRGELNEEFSIATFAGTHSPIADKLNEVMNVIIRYYPQKNNYHLNAALLDIMLCKEDLTLHCQVEDDIFVPAVERLETEVRRNGYVASPAHKPLLVADAEQLKQLTSREIDVLVCVAKGLSSKEIADHLCVSVHTVIKHRANIATKLQIHSTAGLTIYAIVNKLIDLHDIQ